MEFGSPTIQIPAHLEAEARAHRHVDITRCPCMGHSRYNLMISLTLHRTLDMPTEATAIFGTNHVLLDRRLRGVQAPAQQVR